jgi:LAO/AO transport system kinase
LSGDKQALSRLITLVENRDPGAREAIKKLYKHVGNAHIIGVTGIAGVGKSSLIAKLGMAYRKRGKTVGIIAVDPTSPLTGGALLGDRVRMLELTGDKDVFIRSMGTRGSSGGLAIATNDVINILDAFKKDVIIVESIGVGQDEIDIENFVQTLLIVTMPGGGDAVQSIKAGILEFGDIYVVNKADRPETSRMVSELEFMLQLGGKNNEGWEEKIVQTVATMDEGIEELLEIIEGHHSYLEKSGGLEKRRIKRSKAEVLKIVGRMVEDAVKEVVSAGGDYYDLVQKMAASGEMDPYSAAEKILENIDKICTDYRKG